MLVTFADELSSLPQDKTITNTFFLVLYYCAGNWSTACLDIPGNNNNSRTIWSWNRQKIKNNLFETGIGIKSREKAFVEKWTLTSFKKTKTITKNVHAFLCKNKLYKNTQAEICPKIKNKLRLISRVKLWSDKFKNFIQSLYTDYVWSS